MVKKQTVNIISVLALTLSGGCVSHPSGTGEGGRTLSVSMDEQSPSYRDYFDRVELIPLETNDSSMIARVKKAVCINDTLVVYDSRRSLVFAFRNDGTFISRIGRVGDGPEDYSHLSDIAYNEEKGYLTLLTPFGEILDYTAGNLFLRRQRLPSKPNYQACTWLADNRLALWSVVESDEAGLTIVEPGKDETVFSDWYNDNRVDFQVLKPFYRYKEGLYFTAPMENRVYEVCSDSLRFAYMWDLDGINNDDYIKEVSAIEDPRERGDRINNDIKSKVLRYNIEENWQTEEYYLATVTTGWSPDLIFRSLVYSKKKDSGVFMRYFKEGMSFYPILVTEEYAMCAVPVEEIDKYNAILGTDVPADDDMNVVMAKYYFKR